MTLCTVFGGVWWNGLVRACGAQSPGTQNRWLEDDISSARTDVKTHHEVRKALVNVYLALETLRRRPETCVTRACRSFLRVASLT